MKTALILNGNYRTFDKCYPKFLEKFKHLSPDYFINTYDARYMYHSVIRNRSNFYGEESVNIDKFSGVDYKGILIDSYSEMVKTFNEKILPLIHPAMVLENGSSYLQLVKWKKGLAMITKYEVENNFTYDSIILSRFDVIPNSIEHLNLNGLDKKVIMNYGGDGMANDQILITTKKNLMLIIDFMISEFHNYKIPSSRNTVPHTLLKNSIIHNGIIHEEHHKLLHCILRENGLEELVV